MNQNNNKEKLRQKYLKLRHNIKCKNNKSLNITKKIINDSDYNSAKVIAIYKSMPYEVNTNMLIRYSLKIGKIVVVPKIISGKIEFYKVTSDEKYIKNNFGIYEPNNNNLVSSEDINLIIVPGVCFDKNKNRIGFGKGFYDRYLANYKSTIIGICFDKQVTNKNISFGKYDIKMHKIITDKKVI